jgi:hypothetical protein
MLLLEGLEDHCLLIFFPARAYNKDAKDHKDFKVEGKHSVCSGNWQLATSN